MNPLLSIIVPCYNTGKYIEKCLYSIINQNYQNIEVIVVDDGSIDDTREIVNSIIKSDNRIKYIYKENSGVSDTRNKGIMEASGEFITFVDSDDYVEQQIYEVLISLALKYSSDISHCSYSRVNMDGIRSEVGGTGKIYEMNSKDSIEKLLNGGLFAGGVWNKIYKKTILTDVLFDKKYSINEDILFNFYAFLKAEKIIFIDECFYNYLSSDTSSCNHTDIIVKHEQVYSISDEMYQKCIEVGFKDLGYKRVSNHRIILYRAYVFFGTKEQQLHKGKELKNLIIEDYNNKKLVGNQKIDGIVLKYLPILYKPLYFVYDKIRKPNWDV